LGKGGIVPATLRFARAAIHFWKPDRNASHSVADPA
jgi:hypothetical protein